VASSSIINGARQYQRGNGQKNYNGSVAKRHGFKVRSAHSFEQRRSYSTLSNQGSAEKVDLCASWRPQAGMDSTEKN